VARYWSINTAATAVLLSTHPSPIEVAAATAKQLAAAIFGGGLYGGGVLPAQYSPCGADATGCRCTRQGENSNFSGLNFGVKL